MRVRQGAALHSPHAQGCGSTDTGLPGGGAGCFLTASSTLVYGTHRTLHPRRTVSVTPVRNSDEVAALISGSGISDLPETIRR